MTDARRGSNAHSNATNPPARRHSHALLLVAFGSTHAQNTHAVHAFERDARALGQHTIVRWAFTSDLVRKRLATNGKKSDSVSKGLRRMVFENIPHVTVLPLHVVAGLEYEELARDLDALRPELHLAGLQSLTLMPPLLSNRARIQAVAHALTRVLPSARTRDDALIFMGHGSRHPATQAYDTLSLALQALDPLLRVATLSGSTRLEDVLSTLPNEHGRIWLQPLLALIGRHALEDMAGTQPNSWRSRLSTAGFIPEPCLSGLLEHEALRQLWLEPLRIPIEPTSAAS